MQIAIVGPTHPYKGGIAQYTTELAHHLAADGHDVRIESWSRQYPRLLYPGQLTVDRHEITPFPTVNRWLSWRRPDTWYRTGRRLREVDLVVLTVATPFQSPAYRGILAGLGSPRRPKVLAQCHNVLPHERRWVDVRLTRAVLSRVDAVLAHSAKEKAAAESMTDAPVVVAPPAPVLVARAGRQDPGRADTPHRRILFFGLVRPYKGLDVLLRALAAGPSDLSLRVAGEFWGGVEPTERLVSELGLDGRVELRAGYVDAADVPDLFADVDALVLPYRSATASFTALLGFEHGVPVIATRVGTIERDIRDGVDGLICEPNDVGSLAGALHRLRDEGVLAKLRSGVPRVDPEPRWRDYVSALVSAVGVNRA